MREIKDISIIDELENIFKIDQPNFVINCAVNTNAEMAESEKDEANSINNISVANLAAFKKV